MRFFRGIAVSESEVSKTIKNIRKKGLHAGDGRWIVLAPDLKKGLQDAVKLSKLISDNNLSIERTRRKEAETICACGDRDSALYYACVHNRTEEKTEPILIEFKAPIEDIWIDGRDFLYTVFGLWDRTTSSKEQKNKVKNVLSIIFGKELLPYLQQVFQTPKDNSKKRIALVDLAINDHKIIKSHSKNIIWIRGRYRTLFKSAFLVRSPVPPSNIISVQIPEDSFSYPKEYVNLSEILG